MGFQFFFSVLTYKCILNILAIYLINHKPKFESNQDLANAKVNSCLQSVTEILGFELAKDVVAEHLIKNEFNIDKTVDQILNSKTGKFNLILYICINNVDINYYINIVTQFRN